MNLKNVCGISFQYLLQPVFCRFRPVRRLSDDWLPGTLLIFNEGVSQIERQAADFLAPLPGRYAKTVEEPFFDVILCDERKTQKLRKASSDRSFARCRGTGYENQYWYRGVHDF